MNHLLALLPIAIYLTILKVLDSFTLVRWQRLAECVAWGMMACGITIGIENTLTPPDDIFPIIEELLKAVLVAWMLWRRKILFLAEGLCYGAAVGAGFAIVENITYIYYAPDMVAMTALLRGMSTALMHMGCTAIVATITTLPFGEGRGGVGLLVAITLHTIYNMFLLTSFLHILLFIIALLVIFVLLNELNERRIYRWMDHSITSDVQLLVAIKQGHLTDTPTGRYLLSVQQQFQPEVFFDILCYMQLYLQLVIQGKSRMLLRQQSLDAPLTPQEQQRHADMLRELHTLEHNIGIMGKHILRPIIRFNNEDLAILK